VRQHRIQFVLAVAAAGTVVRGQDKPAEATKPTFAAAAGVVDQRLADSIDELAKLRQDIAAQRVPLGRELSELESQLSELRAELQRKSRAIDVQTLDNNNLRTSIKGLQDEASYLGNLLTDYLRNFEARVHIAELKRYQGKLAAARLAAENPTLARGAVFAAQTAVVESSIDRLEEALGGARFDGAAIDEKGIVRDGTFVRIGPAALFRSADGQEVGTAEQRLGSLEPTIIGFEQPDATAAASALVASGAGTFPLDPTLGNAHKIESTHETLWEHVQKGGPVMVPIFGMAALGLLAALYKWLSLAFLGRPSRRRLAALLDCVARRDQEGAKQQVRAIRGPTGRMLAAGVANLGESRELIEEVMYESVLTTRLATNRLLPFISICAASAPLLGLLGTVTGIIDTFKQITIFGSSDVKNLSSGISEALITTEFGLIVAIPALLLHSFLSRKARRVVADMEQAAVAFGNQVARAEPDRTVPVRGDGGAAAMPDEVRVREQVHAILSEMLGPLAVATEPARGGDAVAAGNARP